MPQPRIMFENDSRHTLIYMYEPPITVEDHRQAVDELLGTPVEALLFNLGYGNAFLHATEAGDRWARTPSPPNRSAPAAAGSGSTSSSCAPTATPPS